MAGQQGEGHGGAQASSSGGGSAGAAGAGRGGGGGGRGNRDGKAGKGQGGPGGGGGKKSGKGRGSGNKGTTTNQQGGGRQGGGRGGGGGGGRGGRSGRGRGGRRRGAPAISFQLPSAEELAWMLQTMQLGGGGGGRFHFPQRPPLVPPSAAGEELLARVAAVGPGRVKIVTGCLRGERHALNFDFDMDGDQVTSCERDLALRFLSTLLQETYWGSLNVRVFTNERDPGSGLPIKELHGFAVHEGQADKLSPEQLEECHNTDSLTGAPIEPEPAVRYC